MLFPKLFARKWSPSSRRMVLFAGVCGLASFLMVQSYAARVASRDPGDPVSVVMTTRAIARGAVLADEDLTLAQIPARYAPPDAFTSLAETRSRIALSAVASGEVVTVPRVSSPGGGPLSGLVSPGMRAIVVPSGLPPGAVQAGDRVAVLVTRGEGGTYSETVAEGLEVLQVMAATGSSYSAATDGGTLALLVDPYVAEDIAAAVIGGAVTIVVEPPGESAGG